MFGFAEPEALAACEKDAGVVVMMNASIFMLIATAVAFAKGDEVAPVAGKVRDVLRRFSDAGEADEDIAGQA